MLNINNMQFTARLTRDPEMKYSQSGLAICKLAVAINESRKVNNEWKTETSFLDVTCFDKTAERAAQMTKGDGIYVEGKLKQETWEKDGQKHSKHGCIASVIKPIKDAESGTSERSGGSRKASDGLAFDSGDTSDDVPF